MKPRRYPFHRRPPLPPTRCYEVEARWAVLRIHSAARLYRTLAYTFPFLIWKLQRIFQNSMRLFYSSWPILCPQCFYLISKTPCIGVRGSSKCSGLIWFQKLRIIDGGMQPDKWPLRSMKLVPEFRETRFFLIIILWYVFWNKILIISGIRY